MRLIESVPNISEGRRAPVIADLAAAVQSAPGVQLLDVSADPSHNRSVFTLAGSPTIVRDAILRLVAEALAAIDMRTHTGEHPRMGAVDVVPFVPLGSTPMSDCVALAREVGHVIADRFAIPVYLYEAAALRPERRRLEDIRRGQFEGLAERMKRAEWTPDFGPSQPHPTAGATVVGARSFLIAYNINLATERVEIAKAIATQIRERDGGLPGVKALGLTLRPGVVQVSMNLTDFTTTPIQIVFDRVVAEAAARGVEVIDSELVGLLPAAALAETSPEQLRLTNFTPEKIIEHRIRIPNS